MFQFVPGSCLAGIGEAPCLARVRFAGEKGWGPFEHASMGRHDPTGFADWSPVAP